MNYNAVKKKINIGQIRGKFLFSDSKLIHLAVLKPNPDLLGIDNLASWQTIEQTVFFDPWIVAGTGVLPNPVFVDVGNFDSDAENEIVIAYWMDPLGDKRSKVELIVYDIDDSLKMSLRGGIQSRNELVLEPPDTVSYSLVPIDISDQLDAVIAGPVEKQFQDTIPNSF
jgi:hypothetical protein